VDPQPIVRAVVLAAGAGRRFGGAKLLAELDDRPLVVHVLERLGAAGLAHPVVVVPPNGQVERALAGMTDRVVVNPQPERGLASSLQLGWAAALAEEPQPTAVVVVLGDQPRVSVDVLQRLAAAPLDAACPIVAPRYRGGGGSNPIRVEASAGALVAAATGDRGLGPLLDQRPDLVRWLDVEGTNPDVDTPAELASLRATPTREP
jgi:molybdenum cofactor cytidylyltransferase